MFPFAFPQTDKENAAQAQPVGDMVDIHGPELLADEEVDGVLNETIGMITGDRAGALSVHSGLSESRVFALLGA